MVLLARCRWTSLEMNVGSLLLRGGLLLDDERELGALLDGGGGLGTCLRVRCSMPDGGVRVGGLGAFVLGWGCWGWRGLGLGVVVWRLFGV